jgi:hypothetical protein
MIARLQAEKSRRREARSEAQRAHEMTLVAGGQADKLDLTVAFGGWLEWAVQFQMQQPLGEAETNPAPDPPRRYFRDGEGELRQVDNERPRVADVLDPQPVQIELGAVETAGAGWPPEMHTRFYIVSAGAVLLCDPRGKPLGPRHELQRGQDAAEIARGMWLRRLTGTERGAPIIYPKVRYA